MSRPVRPLLAACLSALAACSAVRPSRSDPALADRMTDCSYAHVVYVQTVKETADPERMRDAERLIPTIGYYLAAGRALSTEEHAEQRYALARERYLGARDAVPRQYPEEVRRRRFLDALAVDMAECFALRKQNASLLDEAVMEYHAVRRPDAP